MDCTYTGRLTGIRFVDENASGSILRNNESDSKESMKGICKNRNRKSPEGHKPDKWNRNLNFSVGFAFVRPWSLSNPEQLPFQSIRPDIQ
jgi:hypothetical protein